MMRWTIRIRYTTGDSFQSYETEGEIGVSWENLDKAKEALARIKELHEAESHNDRLRWRDGTPIDLTKLAGYSKEFSEVCIMLPLDDGTEHQDSTFWRGYFETLHEAIIVPTEDSVVDDGMSFKG